MGRKGNNVDISERLSALAKQMQMTQKQIATESGLSQPYVSQIFRGEKTPPIDTLEAICKVLGVTLAGFFSPKNVSMPPALRRVLEACKGLSYEQLSVIESVARICQVPSSPPQRKATALRSVPVSGRAAAGLPISAVPEHERTVAVSDKYANPNYFVVQAEGDSMIDAGINDGDFVVFQKDAHMDDGCIVLAAIEGATDMPDYTIKRLYRRKDSVALHSANPKYPPMIYLARDVQLAGRFVAIASAAE